MGLLHIRTFGDPVLRSPALPVGEFDERLAALAADMRETMAAAPGVGLAAPQVGTPRRLFTFDAGGEDGESGAFANPEILWRSEETQEGEEGCLSIPGIYFPVVRAMKVRVRAQLLDGEQLEREAEGFLARIFQHEIDHLDGVLFVDRLDPERRREAMKLIRETEFGAAPMRKAPSARAL
jgi:peptide deformylase